MARKKDQKNESQTESSLPPVITEEALENAMISEAMKLAYRQLKEGTASSQVITHFLKLGSTKERVEREILERQKDLLTAKTEAINESKVTESLYREAIDAFRTYSGQKYEDDDT